MCLVLFADTRNEGAIYAKKKTNDEVITRLLSLLSDSYKVDTVAIKRCAISSTEPMPYIL